jgi:hypothetical protein
MNWERFKLSTIEVVCVCFLSVLTLLIGEFLRLTEVQTYTWVDVVTNSLNKGQLILLAFSMFGTLAWLQFSIGHRGYMVARLVCL